MTDIETPIRNVPRKIEAGRPASTSRLLGHLTRASSSPASGFDPAVSDIGSRSWPIWTKTGGQGAQACKKTGDRS